METDNFIGQTVGGYKIVETIGMGGMATVYKAYESTLNRWVAIKILHHREKITLARFEREAKAIAQLRHRNILMVYSYGEQDGFPYMVMEYIEGGTLQDRLANRPLDLKQGIDLIISIAEVLNYAHSRGVIHRDVKPSNILLAQENWPLLADFGLVKLSEDWDEQDELTRSGTSLGTPAYVAPEQARGVEVDYRVDVYSTGVVLYQLVTGRLPFQYTNANKILLAHISEAVPAPREFNAQCPPNLEAVILKAMQKSPADRYDTMQDMADALRDVLKTTKLQADTQLHLGPIGQTGIIDRNILPQRTQELSKPVTSPDKRKPYIFLEEKEIAIELPANKVNIIIGRTHRQIIADIDLGPYGAAEAGISRRHAMLTKVDNKWFIDDLNSLNGTYVNDIPVISGRPVMVTDGDVVRCSHLAFIFRL